MGIHVVENDVAIRFEFYHVYHRCVFYTFFNKACFVLLLCSVHLESDENIQIYLNPRH